MIFVYCALVIFLVWLLVITFYFLKIKNNFAFLMEGDRKKRVDEVLQELIVGEQRNNSAIAKLGGRCDRIENNQRFFIQKVGVVRFNPFGDTGGAQSFAISLCDSLDTGVVITGLYSRGGIRWYVKEVNKGRGVEHELSEEEKKVLRTAKSINYEN